MCREQLKKGAYIKSIDIRVQYYQVPARSALQTSRLDDSELCCKESHLIFMHKHLHNHYGNNHLH
jgi:hypothetical protein